MTTPTVPTTEASAADDPLGFTALESEVRSYSRSWPVVFDRASGATR